MKIDELTILYSKDNNNNIRSWEINVAYNGDYSLIITNYGLIDGKRTLVKNEISEGKNIGKSNETTHLEQAELEAKSKHKRKRQQGWKSFDDACPLIDYTVINTDTNQVAFKSVLKDKDRYLLLDQALSVNKTDINDLAKPNKAQPFKAGKMKFSTYCQPKINGVRGIVYYDASDIFPQAKIRSKEGVQYPIQHICDVFTKFYENNTFYQDIVFDGEIDHHLAEAPSISGAARNPKNVLHKELYFTCFDLAIPDMTQNIRLERRDYLADLMEFDIESKLTPRVDVRNVICRFLYTPTLHSEEDAILFAKQCINVGYEGCIVRDEDAEYAFGRKTYDMMKIKAINIPSLVSEEEFRIYDIVDNGTKGGRRQIQFMLVNNIGKGSVFPCTPGAKDDPWNENRKIRAYDNRNLYIGLNAVVRFGERTRNDLPFHANVVKLLQTF